MSRLPAAVRRRVRERAGSLCEYCLTFSDLTGHAFTVDHIIPQPRRGTSELDNLCLCCFWCNDYKQARTEGRDPLRRDGAAWLPGPLTAAKPPRAAVAW
jgi:5-methylcytosine-specific restriction endonuclease McrA